MGMKIWDRMGQQCVILLCEVKDRAVGCCGAEWGQGYGSGTALRHHGLGAFRVSAVRDGDGDGAARCLQAAIGSGRWDAAVPGRGSAVGQRYGAQWGRKAALTAGWTRSIGR